jgi:hypothetical protein
MSSEIVDYFATEALLIAKLQADIPELKAVYTPSDMATVKESSLNTPCAHLLYRGDRVERDQVGRGERATVFQQWVVVLAARHPASQLSDTTKVRSVVGPLVPKLLKSLQGYQPVDWMEPLRRAGGNPIAGASPTFAYFPFLFEGRIHN